MRSRTSPAALRAIAVPLAAALALTMSGCAIDLTSALGLETRDRGRIVRVIDGDTVEVVLRKGGTETVRLIGIDTPETKRPGTPVECGGPQATDSMVRLAFGRGVDDDGDGLLDRGAGTGRRVRLRTDPTQDERDRYDRLLAYVHLRGGPMLNVAQVRRGWALTYVYAGRPFRHAGRFRAAQRVARSDGRGSWSLCGGRFHAPAG